MKSAQVNCLSYSHIIQVYALHLLVFPPLFSLPYKPSRVGQMLAFTPSPNQFALTTGGLWATPGPAWKKFQDLFVLVISNQSQFSRCHIIDPFTIFASRSSWSVPGPFIFWLQVSDSLAIHHYSLVSLASITDQNMILWPLHFSFSKEISLWIL